MRGNASAEALCLRCTWGASGGGVDARAGALCLRLGIVGAIFRGRVSVAMPSQRLSVCDSGILRWAIQGCLRGNARAEALYLRLTFNHDNPPLRCPRRGFVSATDYAGGIPHRRLIVAVPARRLCVCDAPCDVLEALLVKVAMPAQGLGFCD